MLYVQHSSSKDVFSIRVLNVVDPDQMASLKPADLDLQSIQEAAGQESNLMRTQGKLG